MVPRAARGKGAATGGGERGLALSTGDRACTQALPAPCPSPTCLLGPTAISSFRREEAEDTVHETRPGAARLPV